MSLESLVPPLELCQQLLPGDFPESAMVWAYTGNGYEVTSREVWGIVESIFPALPAPTLAEILEVLPRFSEPYGVPLMYINSKSIGYANPIENIGIDETEHDENLATAALRLWMRMNGREVKG